MSVYMLSCTHGDHLATHHETETLCETADEIHQSWTTAGRTCEHQTLWSEKKAKLRQVKSHVEKFNTHMAIFNI